MFGFSSDAYRDLPRMLAVTESGQTAGTVGVGEKREEKSEGKAGRGGGEGRVKEGRRKMGREEGRGGKGADKRAVDEKTTVEENEMDCSLLDY